MTRLSPRHFYPVWPGSCFLKPHGTMCWNQRRRGTSRSFSPMQHSIATLSRSLFPVEYSIDELPKPLQLENSFADYTSQSSVDNHVLHYTRTYQLKSIRVSLEQMNQVKGFFRSIRDG